MSVEKLEGFFFYVFFYVTCTIKRREIFLSHIPAWHSEMKHNNLNKIKKNNVIIAVATVILIAVTMVANPLLQQLQQQAYAFLLDGLRMPL